MWWIPKKPGSAELFSSPAVHDRSSIDRPSILGNVWDPGSLLARGDGGRYIPVQGYTNYGLNKQIMSYDVRLSVGGC